MRLVMLVFNVNNLSKQRKHFLNYHLECFKCIIYVYVYQLTCFTKDLRKKLWEQNCTANIVHEFVYLGRLEEETEPGGLWLHIPIEEDHWRGPSPEWFSLSIRQKLEQMGLKLCPEGPWLPEWGQNERRNRRSSLYELSRLAEASKQSAGIKALTNWLKIYSIATCKKVFEAVSWKYILRASCQETGGKIGGEGSR